MTAHAERPGEPRRLERALEAAGEMLVGVGRDGHILWASRRFRELFADRYRGERPALSAVLALRTDGGSAVPLDLSAQHRPERFEGVVDTEQGPLYIEATQLPPDVHQHDRVFYVIRDLTATKRASELLERLRRDLDERAVEVEAHEGLLKFAMDDLQRVYEDLLRTQSQLMQADKLATIGLLSAGIAHEINNPLMAVQGFLSAVSAQIEEWKAVPSESLADTRQFLEQARQCAEAMAHIVRDIRMFSRTDKGERVTEDPNRILDSVVSIVFHRFRTKVQLRKEYQELGVIECNPQQLAQVFINLIVNAAQAIPDRGTITLRTRSDGTGVAVDVEDDGCGMTPEVQARLFEPFFTTKGAETGTGLGLGICRDIVRRHGGEIRVKSSPGQGTTFTVSLPKTRSAQ